MTYSIKRSESLFEKTLQMFPGGVHSPVRAFKSVGGTPVFMDHGKGCRITDVDGHTYIDFCNSWGPLILGHCHPRVMEKVRQTIEKGLTFGTPHELSYQLGKTILDHHRFIEMIRFVSSGTEAVMSAIRLARGVTGRNKIIKFEGCYHGHADSLLVKAGSGLATLGTSTSAGIPTSFIAETIVLPLADPEILEQTIHKHREDVAAIIIEPVPANNGLLLQDEDYLRRMRELCTQHGILLIWDEVISGFRLGFEGAAGYYDIAPDILTFGKIVGGGMPVGAYAASREIMSHIAPVGSVYQAGTLSANPVSMAAGLATLEVCLEEGFYQRLEDNTRYFTSGLQEILNDSGVPAHIQSIGSVFWIAFSDSRIQKADDIDPASMEFYKKLHLHLLKNGVYFGPSGYEVGFISDAHTRDDLDQTLSVIKKFRL